MRFKVTEYQIAVNVGAVCVNVFVEIPSGVQDGFVKMSRKLPKMTSTSNDTFCPKMTQIDPFDPKLTEYDPKTT